MMTQPPHKEKHPPTLADVVHLCTAAHLSALLHEPTPTDHAVAAILLQRWLDADPKPETHGSLRSVGFGFKSTVFFLDWVTDGVGSQALQSLAASDRDTARHFVAAFTAHANERIQHYQNACYGGIGAQMSDVIARHWRQVKLRVLGQSLVIEGQRIEQPPYRLRYTRSQRQKR